MGMEWGACRVIENYPKASFGVFVLRRSGILHATDVSRSGRRCRRCDVGAVCSFIGYDICGTRIDCYDHLIRAERWPEHLGHNPAQPIGHPERPETPMRVRRIEVPVVVGNAHKVPDGGISNPGATKGCAAQ